MISKDPGQLFVYGGKKNFAFPLKSFHIGICLNLKLKILPVLGDRQIETKRN
jgi:hypothetical protein